MSEVLGEEKMGNGCSWVRFLWGWWKCPKLDSGDGYTTLNKLNLLNFILSKVKFYNVNCMSIKKKKAKWIQWFSHKNCRKILLAFRLLVRKIYAIQIFNPFMDIFSSLGSITSSASLFSHFKMMWTVVGPVLSIVVYIWLDS